MARRSSEAPAKTAPTLVMRLADIISSDGTDYGAPLLIDGKKRAVQQRGTKLMSISQNLIRVQEEADPLQFLINAQRGALFPVVTIDEEDMVTVKYQQFSLAERNKIARFLADKLVPSISLTRVIAEDNTEDGAKASFSAIVELAAARANQHPSHKMSEIAVDAEEVEDGAPEPDHNNE